MIYLYDITSSALPHGLVLSAKMNALLSHRLNGLDEELLPWTEIVIVQPGDTADTFASELGFDPLVDPVDGHRWPDPRFSPGWDYLAATSAAFQLNFSFGSTFGLITLVERPSSAWPELQALCEYFARREPD